MSYRQDRQIHSTDNINSNFNNSENAVRDNRDSFNGPTPPGIPGTTDGLGAPRTNATPSLNTHPTSGLTNSNRQSSNMSVIRGLTQTTVLGDHHVSTTVDNSTTSGCHNTQSYTTAYSNNINSNQWDSNNRFENNRGSFNGPGLQQVSSSVGHRGPIPVNVPENASGLWYSHNLNSNLSSSGNIVSKNTGSFNATRTLHGNTVSQSSSTRAGPRPVYSGSQHLESNAHHVNPPAPHDSTQSGNVIWSENKKSNHFGSNNRIEGNTDSFNGTGEQFTYSAYSGRTVNNPFAQGAASRSNGIYASYNEDSNYLNSVNTVSNNKGSFNHDMNRQELATIIMNAYRQLGYEIEIDEEELRQPGSLEYHREFLKLDLSQNNRSNGPAASDLRHIMKAIPQHRAKRGRGIPNSDNRQADSTSFDKTYQDLL